MSLSLERPALHESQSGGRSLPAAAAIQDYLMERLGEMWLRVKRHYAAHQRPWPGGDSDDAWPYRD